MIRIAFMEEVWLGSTVLQDPIYIKMGLNRPLMHEILEKLDDCEGRLSELFLVSATEEKEINCPIKPAYQENSDEIVYLSGKGKGSLRS